MYQYFVKVVPTVYKQLSGEVNSDNTNIGSLQGSEEQGSGDLWCLTLLNIHSLQYKIVKWGCRLAIFK